MSERLVNVTPKFNLKDKSKHKLEQASQPFAKWLECSQAPVGVDCHDPF